MEQPKIQDDITICLKAQKIVVHETVRINVGIVAQVDPTKNENEFRAEIQSTLHNFIDTDWKIQSIHRMKSNSKYENVSISATGRVSESENYQLAERATSLSRIGFELVNPSVDYSLTFDEIQEINEELRSILFENALLECDQYNEAIIAVSKKPDLYANYRVSSSRFDNGDNNASNARSSNSGQYMMASASMASMNTDMMVQETQQDTGGEGSSDLNVSTRFSMTGQFVLRAVRE